MDKDERQSAPSGSDEPSVTSSLERLVMASQGVVTKHIDLALLETQETITRAAIHIVMTIFGAALAAGAWFALVTAAVVTIAPDASLAVQAVLFAAVNAVAAAALIVPSLRRPKSAPATRSGVTAAAA